jgi:hypothetical protein
MTKELELKPANCAQQLFYNVEQLVLGLYKLLQANTSASALYNYIFMAHRFDPACCQNVIACSYSCYLTDKPEVFCLMYLERLVGLRLAKQAYYSSSCLDHAKDMCRKETELAQWIKRYFGELTDDQPKPIFGANPQPIGYEYSHEAMSEAWLDAAKEDAFNSLFIQHIKPKFCNSKISTRTREGGGMTIEETL